MENFMLLSITNIVITVGITYYFRKKIAYLESQLWKGSYSLQDIIRRTANLEKINVEQELGKISYTLNDIIRRTANLEKTNVEIIEAQKLLAAKIEDEPDMRNI